MIQCAYVISSGVEKVRKLLKHSKPTHFLDSARNVIHTMPASFSTI
jgi:hypothetical protein